MIEKNAAELAGFVRLVWEGMKRTAASSNKPVLIRRGLRIPKTVYEKYKKNRARFCCFTCLQSFSLNPAVSENFPIGDSKPGGGEIDVIMELESIDRPLIQGMSETQHVREQEVLLHPCSTVLIKDVVEIVGKKPVILLTDLRIVPDLLTSVHAPVVPLKFKVYLKIEGETDKQAVDVAPSDTISAIVASLSGDLERTDLCGLRDAEGVRLLGAGTAGGLLESGQTYTVFCRVPKAIKPVQSLPEIKPHREHTAPARETDPAPPIAASEGVWRPADPDMWGPVDPASSLLMEGMTYEARKDYKTAASFYTKAAELGNVDAMWMLAV
jgi:hypothetical protein